MKFNEKLIELRKKAGLSQEALGEKLNVTRQTVSKWELGQTAPGMDMLSEMSKIFGISVDELINEEGESKIDASITTEHAEISKQKSSKSREKIIVGILVSLLVVAIVSLLLIVTNKSDMDADNNKTEITEQSEGFLDKFFGIFEKIFGNVIEDFEKNDKEFDVKGFNNPLSIYNGSTHDLGVKAMIDHIITTNKTGDRKVSVIYDGVETQEETELRSMKSKLDGNYEVIFDYDTEGYITRVTIEKTYTKFDISVFNTSLEMSAGTKYGGSIKSVLDEIMTKNKTGERKITVVYGKIETQDETKIKDIKKKMDSFTEYELSFEYDEIGFINKAIIE